MTGRHAVDATPDEVAARLLGDDLVAADVVMDRGFTLDAGPARVWPWLVQLGPGRGGWYFPTSVERFVPPTRRGARRVLAHLQDHRVGDTVADWGGPDATLTLVAADEPHLLLHRAQRGRATVTWALALSEPSPGRCRVHSRVRIGPVRRRWLAESVGDAFDRLTILGLAAGLRERLAGPPR